jgi:hypothetical protein
MACCHDPLPRRNPPSLGCVISLVGFGASPSGLVHKPSMAPQPTLQTGGKKRPRPEGPGQKLLDAGKLGMQCRPASRPQRAPARLVPVACQGCGIAAPTRHHPSRIAKYAFPQPCDSVSNTLPIGVFPPIRLGPVPTGLFLGHRAKKEQGRALLDNANPWPAFCFCCRAAHQGALGALPPTTWDRAAKPSGQPVLRLTYDYSKLSRAACHHSTQTRCGEQKRTDSSGTVSRCRDSVTAA